MAAKQGESWRENAQPHSPPSHVRLNLSLAADPPQMPKGEKPGAQSLPLLDGGQWILRNKRTISGTERCQIYFLPWIVVKDT